MSDVAMNGAPPGAPPTVSVGRDVSGTMIVGDGNVLVTAESGSQVTVHAGTLPKPRKRDPIAHLPRKAAEPLLGRGRELDRLRQAVRVRRPVQIWGPPGIGKSTLLRHAALALPRDRQTDGVAYVEARGRTAEDLAQAIFDISFDAPNYKPSREVLKEHLKILRLRIYLDDVDLPDADLSVLFDLAPQSIFVFTGKSASQLPGVQAQELGGLTGAAVITLLTTLLGRSLLPSELPVVAALGEALGGSPLRLRRMVGPGTTSLPDKSALPGLLPALIRRLRPEQSDVVHVLGSIAGAELSDRHLSDLLALPDATVVAEELARYGLLLASETGYRCPPDVASEILKQRINRYPAADLCRCLTTWVAAAGTTPDDAATYYQALDAAVRRVEAEGHADLGVALARAASPKLARSRQFDAWGSLIGAGWSAANTAGDKQAKAYFLHEEGVRKKALGNALLATNLLLAAATLWQEAGNPRMHAAARQLAQTTASHSIHPVTAGAAAHSAALVHMSTMTQPTIAAPAAAPTPLVLPHGPVVQPKVDFSHLNPHPGPVPQPAAPPTPHLPVPAHVPTTAPRPVFRMPGAHPGLGATTTGTAAGGGHVTGAGAVAAKVGAFLSILGLLSATGMGIALYVNSNAQSPVAPSPSPTSVTTTYVQPTPTDAASTSAYTDPVCGPTIEAVDQENQQYSNDSAALDSAVSSYNSAMNAYNSGATSTKPSFSPVSAAANRVVGDLDSMQSTVESAQAQAQNSSVVSSLDQFRVAVSGMITANQSFANQSTDNLDTSSEADAANAAIANFNTACGGS